MQWNRNVDEIPPKAEILVLTDLGEVLIAWRNRKNGRYLDVKTLLNGKIEWLPKNSDLKKRMGTGRYCPVVYWSKIANLTKKQYEAVFEPSPRWNKMFNYTDI